MSYTTKGFYRELKILKEFSVHAKLKIKPYKKIYYLVYIKVDKEEKSINIRISHHEYHEKYISDIKKKIRVPCNHCREFEDPILEDFEKV